MTLANSFAIRYNAEGHMDASELRTWQCAPPPQTTLPGLAESAEMTKAAASQE